MSFHCNNLPWNNFLKFTRNAYACCIWFNSGHTEHRDGQRQFICIDTEIDIRQQHPSEKLSTEFFVWQIVIASNNVHNYSVDCS